MEVKEFFYGAALLLIGFGILKSWLPLPFDIPESFRFPAGVLFLLLGIVYFGMVFKSNSKNEISGGSFMKPISYSSIDTSDTKIEEEVEIETSKRRSKVLMLIGLPILAVSIYTLIELSSNRNIAGYLIRIGIRPDMVGIILLISGVIGFILFLIGLIKTCLYWIKGK